jgi:hypothetical protein
VFLSLIVTFDAIQAFNHISLTKSVNILALVSVTCVTSQQFPNKET